MTSRELHLQVFACDSCHWIEILEVPADRPATDVARATCSGCGNIDVLFYKLHGIRGLIDSYEAGEGRTVRCIEQNGDYDD